jgi:hypothetical protein
MSQMHNKRTPQSFVGMAFALLTFVVFANSLIAAKPPQDTTKTQAEKPAKKKSKVCAVCLKDDHTKEVEQSAMDPKAADAPGSPITVLADKNASYVDPPIPLGDGHELKVELVVPAGKKITSLDKFPCADGGSPCNYECKDDTCRWTHQSEIIRLTDNRWAWIGWSNTGRNHQLKFVVHYQ